MSTISHDNQEDDDSVDKNAPYRSARRAARRTRAVRSGHTRRLTIYSELREQPDVRKIARAILAIATAEAEREAQAAATPDTTPEPHEAANE
jgi:hypothetical protein